MLVVQDDCNVVINHSKAIWTTNTWGASEHPIQFRLNFDIQYCLAWESNGNYGRDLYT